MKEVEEIISVTEEWRTAADKEKSYFVKYALEFFAFNSLLRLNFGNGREPERNLIERCKGCLRCNEQSINDDLKNAIQAMLKITRENPLKNLTRQRRINIKDLNNWNNIIEAVYTN